MCTNGPSHMQRMSLGLAVPRRAIQKMSVVISWGRPEGYSNVCHGWSKRITEDHRKKAGTRILCRE